MAEAMVDGGLVDAPRPGGDRSRRARRALPLLVLLSLVACAVSLATGASGMSFRAALFALPDLIDGSAVNRDRLILLDLRLPRTVLGFVTGASLAVSGAVMQGLFRNPLADPGLAGVSSGAAMGAVLMIVLGSVSGLPIIAFLGIHALPVAAFLGGLGTTLLLYRIATSNGQTSVATLLLAGIALAALMGAGTGFLVFLADDRQLRDLTFWGMGSLSGATWAKIAAALPIMLAGLAATPFLARALNALALGEAAAFHMGIPVERVKRLAILSVSAATGASVAVTGGIGFVGIVVPHLLRMAIGPDHRFLLPASALLGGALLVLADSAARIVVAPAELPIGIVTAAVGAPFFLYILLRNRAQLAL